MSMTCCLWIISGFYDYFHGAVGYDILECYFGCHATFGLVMVRIIFIMKPIDIMYWSMITEMILVCGS